MPGDELLFSNRQLWQCTVWNIAELEAVRDRELGQTSLFGSFGCQGVVALLA